MEVSEPGSIIIVDFMTVDFDIQFGLFMATSSSKFELCENEKIEFPKKFSTTPNDEIQGYMPLVEVYPMKLV